jgi:hypothetical protein
MKRTLIIHPTDYSTDFLNEIYEDIPFKTIINGKLSKKNVCAEIDNHDRIIMMGHGSPKGLFGINFDYEYIIDKKVVPHLLNKENIFIWCYASDFVRTHKLNGFSTGMFISEQVEAVMCGVKTNHEEVEHSNMAFTALMQKYISYDINNIYENVLHSYGEYANKTKNKVSKYNNERLWYQNNIINENALKTR